MDDRRAGREARQGVGGYFCRLLGYVRIGFLGGLAVDGGFDDHRVRGHVRNIADASAGPPGPVSTRCVPPA